MKRLLVLAAVALAGCGTHSPGPLPGVDVAVQPAPNPPSVTAAPVTTAGESTASASPAVYLFAPPITQMPAPEPTMWTPPETTLPGPTVPCTPQLTCPPSTTAPVAVIDQGVTACDQDPGACLAEVGTPPTLPPTGTATGGAAIGAGVLLLAGLAALLARRLGTSS